VCLWIHGGATGDVHVLDEYVQPERTMDEHIEHIQSRTRWGKITRVSCDPPGSGRNDQTAASNVQLLRSRGYTVRTRHSQIQDGLELIRAALKPAAGKATLFVHKRCERLIKALTQLPLRAGRQRTAGEGRRARSPDRCAAVLVREPDDGRSQNAVVLNQGERDAETQRGHRRRNAKH
jgi:hypothetical protein